MFSLKRPIQVITPHATVRVLHDKRFVLVWTDNNWRTSSSIQSRGLGSAGFAADIPPSLPAAAGENPSALSLTFFWPDDNHWLGYNYDIRIESMEADA
jgi:hypothetical protein